MSRVRASSLPSQANLMHQRGDLRGTSARFKVQLDKPSPTTIHADPLARLGLEVKRDSSRSRLVIEDIDMHPRQRTPVAQWNTAEERQADRGAEEKHCSLAMKPGDRIKAVNDLNSATLMLSELQEAAKPEEPKKVNLEVSRDISNVLSPSSPKKPPSRGCSVPAIREMPSERATMYGRPPRPPRSPSKGESHRAATGVNWRSPSKAREDRIGLHFESDLRPQERSRGRAPSPAQAAQAARRAVSTGGFERQMLKSSSQGSLSSAALIALRP